jgi:putative redox protein
MYRLTWTEDLTFESETPEGLGVTMDASPEFGGKGRGPRPAELLLLGLGGCTGMDVVSILRKKRAPIESVDIEIETERAKEHPKVFTKIEVRFVIGGKGVKGEDVERAIALSSEKYCVVGAMIKGSCEVNYSWRMKD